MTLDVGGSEAADIAATVASNARSYRHTMLVVFNTFPICSESLQLK